MTTGAGGRPRLLVVTDNQTLLVALTVRGEWDVLSDVDEAEPGLTAVLVDDDGSDRIHQARQLAERFHAARTVVITDRAEPVDADEVIARPYRFDDLLDALERVSDEVAVDIEVPDEAAAPDETAEPSRDRVTGPVPAPPRRGIKRLLGRDRPDLEAGGEESPEAPDVPEKLPEPEPVEATRPEPSPPSEPAEPDAPPKPWVARGDTERRRAGARSPRRRPATESGTSAARGLAEEIATARRSTARILRLLDRIPRVASFETVANALLDEVIERVEVELCLIFRLRDGSYHVVADRGLTSGERRSTVPADHPLVGEVVRNGGVLLVEGHGQALLSGWAGSRSPSYLLVPASAGAPPEVLLGVGRRDLSVDDLHLIGDLAAEAGNGLDLALALGRLAERLAEVARD